MAELVSAGKVRYLGVREMADEKGVTPAQLALAWVARQENVVPIPGRTKPERPKENAEALKMKLTDKDLAGLDEIAPRDVAIGDRYNE